MFDQRAYLSGLALAASLIVSRTASADAAPATAPTSQVQQQALLDRISALESQVQELKQVAARTAQAEHADAIAATSAKLQREADESTGVTLMSHEGFTAGYDDGKFQIRSADGRYVLHPWVQLQIRYETTNRDRAKFGGVSADTQSGFELRRLKLGFDGNVISPDLTYQFQFAVDRKTGIFSLEQAYGKYRIPGTPFYIKGGQYKEPLDHEQLLASRYLTSVDRTFSNDLFTNSEGFVQGVSVGYDNGGAIRAEGAFTDGMRSANTNFLQFPNGTSPADWGAAGRAEYKFFGKWKDYDRSTGAYNASDDFLVAGAGADWTEAGDTNVITQVADVDYGSTSGLGVYGAFTGRAFDKAAIGSIGSDGGTIGSPKKFPYSSGYDYSVRGQVSYAINQNWEPYAQYEYIHLDPSNLPAGARGNLQVIRAGVNYYLFNTEARLTVDFNYLPNGSPISDDGIGILATGAPTKTTGWSRGGGNEYIVRAQFQLAL